MGAFPGRLVLLATSLALGPASAGAPLVLPTDNRALFEPGGEERFFAPTPGKSWTSGQFGCVRSEGQQFHEGIDILVTRRDRRGEPTDPVRAVADGSVVYVNRAAARSSYGIYVVLRHAIDGIQIFSLYAHLKDVRPERQPGTSVRQGEILGTMGRTTNTRTPISRDRAHLHLEIVLLTNDRFTDWLKAREPKSRNDHGPWNGRNLLGLDPAAIFREQARLGDRFRLPDFVRNQTELFRILVDCTDFPWLRRYPMLIRRNPRAEREGIAAYELSLNFNGVPFQAIPRAPGELRPPLRTRVLQVNEAEQERHSCRQLIFKRGQAWVLTAKGEELIDLLTF